MKRLVYLILFLISFASATRASHIVGGQIYYQYLGNDSFRISLVEYRNCGSCPSGQCARYDTTSYVWAFDSAGSQTNVFGFPYTTDTTLPFADTADCFSTLGYCIQRTVYTGVVYLPNRPGGYTLAYQRCCRNAAIVNIIGNSGATYYCTIPDSVWLSGHNSSPRFKEINPGLHLVYSPFSCDVSAIDPDGDSLAYRLTDVLDGASISCPNPSLNGLCNDTAPPYTSVVYLSPYSANNPTNNPLDSGHLRIDPYTGLLSGTVNQVGIFEVAIAADEFRQGRYISTSILNFQFAFSTCEHTGILSVKTNPSPQLYTSNGSVYVNMTNMSDRHAAIHIYDALGREIASSVNTTESVNTINLSSISPQIVIVKVSEPNGIVTSRKILVAQ
jgi:hypothetical protein